MVVREVAACCNLVGGNDVDVVFEEVGIEAGHFGTGGTIDEDAVEDVHANDLVVKPLDVTLWRCCELFAEVLQIDTFASEHRIVSACNTHDIELESEFALQLFLLLMNLLNEAATNGSNTTNEEVQHLVFGEEERVVDDVKCFAEEVLIDDERDVRLAGTLRTSNDADTRATERSEELAGNTRRVLHVLANDSDCCQAFLGKHREHCSILNLLLELEVQDTTSLVGIFVLNANTGTVLTGSLTDHKDAYPVVGQASEDAAIDTNHTHHRKAGNRDERGSLDARDTLNASGIVFYVVLDDRTWSIGIESVLDEDGNVLDANGINRWRINDFSTEVTELHRFDVGQFWDDVSRADDLGVGRHEAIHVGPNLKHACFKSRSNDAGCIVATTSTQVGHFSALDICADETTNYNAFTI